jgi:hypothetical protein
MRPEFKAQLDKFHADHGHHFKKGDDGDGDKDIGEPAHNETASELTPRDAYNAERRKRGMAPVTGDGSHHSHFQPRKADKGHFKGPPSAGWGRERKEDMT